MKTIKSYRKELDDGKVTSEELFQEARKKILENKEINAYVTVLEEKEEQEGNSILKGIPYGLKDNFSTKGILTTASSNILKDYVPVYDATVYKKLKASGAVLLGKTTMDELAMGGTGTTGHTGVVRNPLDPSRLIGGSSAGSCASVVAGITPFAIGSDTGDSVRKPASYGGVVGFKPTYGRISRYGLFAFASSMDHVAYFTNTTEDAAILTDILKGPDKMDMTTLEDDGKKYTETLENDVTGRKLFYFKDVTNPSYYQDKKDPILTETLTKFHETIEKIKTLGIEVEEVDFDKNLLTAIYPAYMTISCAEATSNNANLTGIQFGPRGEGDTPDEIMMDARTKGFSELIKRRFILGSYILQKENQEKLFLNAGRVRRLIVDKMTELFQTYDGLIMPASGGIAPHFEDASDALSDAYLILENHMAIGNFGGFPSITIPSGIVHQMPVAINITGRVLEDDVVLNIAHQIEKKLNFQKIKEEARCEK